MFRRFPFGSPAYQWNEIAAEANVVAFDCVRFPAAEYFASKNKSALCVGGPFAIWISRSRRIGEPSLNEPDRSRAERNTAIFDGGTAQSSRRECRDVRLQEKRK
jgi:hypothetical protein